MARLEPILKPTETYTESNFLRLHMVRRFAGGAETEVLVTIEHLYYGACGTEATGGGRGWCCETIVDGEAMSREDALFIARSYASRNGIPVIYESRAD